MILMKKLYPNDSRYSLNHFLEKLKLEMKHDVSYEIMEQYRINSTLDPKNKINLSNMGKVIAYCVNDSLSVMRLWNKRKILNDNRELSKITYTDLSHSFFRANGDKVFNMVSGYTLYY